MKKLFIAIVCLSSLSTVQSQIYLQGGINLANITRTASGQTENNSILTTFNAGFLSRMGLSKTIDVEAGLLFTGKGSKAETYFGTGTSDNYSITKFNPFYLEMPLNLVIRIPVIPKLNLFAYGGPYAAIGVAGKSTTNSKIIGANSSSQNDIRFSNDDPFTSEQDDASYNKLKRFDFGLNAGAGLDLGKLILKVNYGYGLTKINSTQSDNSVDDKNKFRTVSLSVNVRLSK